MFSLFCTSKFSPVCIIFGNTCLQSGTCLHSKISKIKLRHSFIDNNSSHTIDFWQLPNIHFQLLFTHGQIDFKKGLVFLSNTNKGIFMFFYFLVALHGGSVRQCHTITYISSWLPSVFGIPLKVGVLLCGEFYSLNTK